MVRNDGGIYDTIPYSVPESTIDFSFDHICRALGRRRRDATELMSLSGGIWRLLRDRVSGRGCWVWRIDGLGAVVFESQRP